MGERMEEKQGKEEKKRNKGVVEGTRKIKEEEKTRGMERKEGKRRRTKIKGKTGMEGKKKKGETGREGKEEKRKMGGKKEGKKEGKVIMEREKMAGIKTEIQNKMAWQTQLTTSFGVLIFH